MDGDSSSARVDYGSTSLASFGTIAEVSAPETSIRDALVDKGAEAPKPCLPPAEMRTPTAAGGLLPAGIASTATRTTFSRPLSSWTTSTSLPLPGGGRLFKQNQSKLWCLIPTVVEVTYAAACFWEGGARWFAGSVSFGRRMVSKAGVYFW